MNKQLKKKIAARQAQLLGSSSSEGEEESKAQTFDEGFGVESILPGEMDNLGINNQNNQDSDSSDEATMPDLTKINKSVRKNQQKLANGAPMTTEALFQKAESEMDKSNQGTHNDLSQRTIKVGKLQNQHAMSIDKLKEHLKEQVLNQNLGLMIGILRDLIDRTVNDKDRLEHLKMLRALYERVNMIQESAELISAILLLEPDNFDMHLRSIKKLSEQNSRACLWTAYTEIMRFKVYVSALTKCSRQILLQHKAQAAEIRGKQLGYQIEDKIRNGNQLTSFRVMGQSNINACLGVTVQEPEGKIFRLLELGNRKLLSFGVGDYHTLVVGMGCSHVDILGGDADKCKGTKECCNGTDVYAWGLNKHGQVNGIVQDETASNSMSSGFGTQMQSIQQNTDLVQTPEIINFFLQLKPRSVITHVAACRSRSVAVSDNNEVYEWGYLSDERPQFDQTLQLPYGKVKQIAAGLSFNLYLMHDGTCYMSGEVAQSGETFMDTKISHKVLNLNDDLYHYEKIKVKFVQVQCGYSHAVLLDEDGLVYSFGAGSNGQLGSGIDMELSRYPLPMEIINNSADKVKLITCGAYFTVCYTELGILYTWGMHSPDNLDSVIWYPQFMQVSIPQSDYEQDMSFLYEFHLTDIQASYREVIACDSKGRVYHADLSLSQTLKIDPVIAGQVGRSFKVLVGRTARFFLDQIIALEKCRIEPIISDLNLEIPAEGNKEENGDEEEKKKVEEDDDDPTPPPTKGLPRWETKMQNYLSLRLCDTDSKNYYLNKPLDVVILINSEPEPQALDRNFIKQFVVKNPGLNENPDDLLTKQHKTSKFNEVEHLFQKPQLCSSDHSLLELMIAPEEQGLYFLHVYLFAGQHTAIELANSPQRIEIVLSDIHKQQLKEKAMTEEALRLERLRLEELNREKQRKLDEAKRLAQLRKEEEARLRREETAKRAAEAARLAKEKADAERAKEERDRRLKKELRTGGGFDLKKYKKMQDQGLI